MKCQYPGCNKPATVHLTEIKNGAKKEVHLCEEHASKMGLPGKDHFSLTDLLAGVAKTKEEAPVEEEQECARCGLTLSRFQSTGRFGCSECYTSFRDEILPLVEKIHDSSQHVGRAPGRVSEVVTLEQDVRNKRVELDKAIHSEDYEKAASLRDEIKVLEDQLDAKRSSSEA